MHRAEAILWSAQAVDPDWRHASAASTGWSDCFSPQHFYPFSLKALAFICLRPQESRDILDKLAEIDPQDSVGSSVIRGLMSGAVD